MTLKEIKVMQKPFPYKEVADKLNNLPSTELNTIDRIIGEAEHQSCNMVGIKKLLKMVTNPIVKEKMIEQYHIQ